MTSVKVELSDDAISEAIQAAILSKIDEATRDELVKLREAITGSRY